MNSQVPCPAVQQHKKKKEIKYHLVWTADKNIPFSPLLPSPVCSLNVKWQWRVFCCLAPGRFQRESLRVPLGGKKAQFPGQESLGAGHTGTRLENKIRVKCQVWRRWRGQFKGKPVKIGEILSKTSSVFCFVVVWQLLSFPWWLQQAGSGAGGILDPRIWQESPGLCNTKGKEQVIKHRSKLPGMQKKLILVCVWCPGRGAAPDQRQGPGDEQNHGTLVPGVGKYMTPQQWEQGTEWDF